MKKLILIILILLLKTSFCFAQLNVEISRPSIVIDIFPCKKFEIDNQDIKDSYNKFKSTGKIGNIEFKDQVFRDIIYVLLHIKVRTCTNLENYTKAFLNLKNKPSEWGDKDVESLYRFILEQKGVSVDSTEDAAKLH